jgi:TonB family protein
MADAMSIYPARGAAGRAADETLSILIGAGLTFGLFAGLAHFEFSGAIAPPAEIEDLRIVAAPPEPPPPVEEHLQRVDVATPLTGIEISAQDSPVKIAVIPPDLSKLFPTTEIPPKATIMVSQLLTDFRPRSNVSSDFDRIFKASEVDQVPAAILKTIAKVPSYVRNDAFELKVTLEAVIDTDGFVTTISVLRSSGNAKFDSIVARCVKQEWEFSPAIRKGKKVRCLVQQLVWYQWSAGSPFTL